MKTLAKIIYTIIVCRFLMGIRERLMSKVQADPTKCLLIGYHHSDEVALLFGYADNPKTLHQLLRDMVARGFEPVAGEKMAIVNPIGNNMFNSVYSEERIGPYRLCSTSRGRWYDVAQKYGMRQDVMDSMCGMK
jgi:hypothetical protein